MMRYLILHIFAVSFLVAGCSKKTDETFDKPADERIQESLTAYRTALTQAPGWKLFVYPSGLRNQGVEAGGLTYYLRFPDSSRVTMVSDFAVDMASVPKESGFRVRAVQRPSLIFDTYSYIHVAADPDEIVSFSPAQAGGYGWGTDFDFSFLQAAPEGDSIRLLGNFNETDALLLRATSEEMADAFNGKMAQIMNATSNYIFQNDFLYFTGTDNARVEVSLNLFLYRVNFTSGSGSQLSTVTAPFSHTTYGLHFKQPVTAGGYTFQDAYWDDAAKVYYLDASGTRVNLANSTSPVYPTNMVLGQTVTTISVPVPSSLVPGQSAAFDSVYQMVEDSLLLSPYGLDLRQTDFVFDSESRSMAIIAYVQQSGVTYIAQYVYTYTLGANKTTRFTRVGENGNGAAVEDDMRPLLDYIESDEFEVNYSTEGTRVLGRMTSIDNPDFFFTGNLR